MSSVIDYSYSRVAYMSTQLYRSDLLFIRVRSAMIYLFIHLFFLFVSSFIFYDLWDLYVGAFASPTRVIH